MTMDAKQVEMLEVLDGARSSPRKRRAIRSEDLSPLLQLQPKLKSTAAAGATPTKAEFDALRTDVNTILQRLNEIGAVVQKDTLG